MSIELLRLGFSVELGYAVNVTSNEGNLTQEEYESVMYALADYADEPNQKNLDEMLNDWQGVIDLEEDVVKRAKLLHISCEVVHRDNHANIY